MTGQEIECDILRLAIIAEKAHRGLAPHRASEELDVDIDTIKTHIERLQKERLLRTRRMGGSRRMVVPNEKEITEKGRQEYKRRCQQR